MIMAHRLVLALMLVLMISCSKDKTETVGDATPPPAKAPAKAVPAPAKTAPELSAGGMSLAIFPEVACANSPFTYRAQGLDGTADRIAWLQNGMSVSMEDTSTFNSDGTMLSRGDSIQARMTVGQDEVYSNTVEIGNCPPELVKYDFNRIETGMGGYYMDVEAIDIDGDAVTLEYEWLVNEMPSGVGPRLEMPLRPEDKISVIVRVTDGLEYGKSARYDVTYVNQAPTIEPVPEYYVVGNDYIYNAVAEDPDGGVITFTLKSAPQGMTINANSGQVRWEIPKDFLGTIQYTIVVTDSDGYSSWLPMNFTVSK